jgi:hypothetical protein
MNASKLNVGGTPIINGTVGRILFQGASDTLGESANLFWDNTNGRLGIGTSTPTNPIQLLSSANASFFAKVQNTSSGALATTGYEMQSNTAYGSIFATSSNYTPYGVLGASQIGFYTSNTFAIALDSSSADFKIGVGTSAVERFRIKGNTGNVLINTTTDAGYKLDVNGTARIINQATFGATGTDGSVRFLRSVDGANVGYIQVNQSGLQVGNGTYAFFHNNSLNGINVGTNPLAMWHIKGLGATSATTSLLVQQSTGVDILKVTNDMYVTVQNTNNAECFQVRGANDDATIRFTPSGGTSNIVLRSQASSITLSTTANSFGDLRVSAQGQTLRIGTSLSSAGGGVNYYSSQNGSIHSHRWFHNNAEQMSLQYTGNLLIGTTTDAGYKLDVNGTARFGNVNQSTNANSITAGYEGGFLLSGGVAALKRDTTGYLKTLLDCGYDGGLRIRPYSSGFTSYVDVRSDTSAALTVTSTNQGFLPPRMTNAQRTAIASPAVGLIVYCTDVTEGLWIYKSSGWTFIV